MSEKQSFIEYVKAMENALLDMPVFLSELIDMSEEDIESAQAYFKTFKDDDK